MHMEAARPRKSDPAVDAMTEVVEVDGFGRVGAWDALHSLVEQLRDRDDRAHAVALEMDWSGLDTKERADQWLEPRRGPSGLAAGDRRQRLALVRLAACVHYDTERPITIRHRARRPRNPREPEMVQSHFAVATALDIVDVRDNAITLRRPNRSVRRWTQTCVVTVARLNKLPLNPPVDAGHGAPFPTALLYEFPHHNRKASIRGQSYATCPKSASRSAPVVALWSRQHWKYCRASAVSSQLSHVNSG